MSGKGRKASNIEPPRAVKPRKLRRENRKIGGENTATLMEDSDEPETSVDEQNPMDAIFNEHVPIHRSGLALKAMGDEIDEISRNLKARSTLESYHQDETSDQELSLQGPTVTAGPAGRMTDRQEAKPTDAAGRKHGKAVRSEDPYLDEYQSLRSDRADHPIHSTLEELKDNMRQKRLANFGQKKL